MRIGIMNNSPTGTTLPTYSGDPPHTHIHTAPAKIPIPLRIPVHPCALLHSSTIQWCNIPGSEGEQQWAPTTVTWDGIGDG